MPQTAFPTQNLYLASFPQVPAGQRVPRGRPLTLLSDATMQSHTAAFSFPLSLPALSGLAGNPGNNQHSRKPQGLRLWGVGSGFWVWRQVAPAQGNSTHRDHSNLLIPSSNQRLRRGPRAATAPVTHGGQGWDLLRASDQPGSQGLLAPGPSSRSPPSNPQQLHPLGTDRPGASFPKLLRGALGSLKGSGTEAGGSHPVTSEPHLQEQTPPIPRLPCHSTTTSGYLPLILP